MVVLDVVVQRAASSVAIKLATSGGLRSARQVETIARAARLYTMVSYVIEPALLTAAGQCLALSSSKVRYGDLDGHLELIGDPTASGFRLEEGVLIATDAPGLGYMGSCEPPPQAALPAKVTAQVRCRFTA